MPLGDVYFGGAQVQIKVLHHSNIQSASFTVFLKHTLSRNKENYGWAQSCGFAHPEWLSKYKCIFGLKNWVVTTGLSTSELFVYHLWPELNCSCPKLRLPWPVKMCVHLSERKNIGILTLAGEKGILVIRNRWWNCWLWEAAACFGEFSSNTNGERTHVRAPPVPAQL